MTNNTLSCDQFADRLADFLERDVDEATRAAVESHALVCGDCGPLLADLRKLRIDAANLPELVASRDLWSGVEARIATPVVELGTRYSGLGTREHHAPARRRWMVNGLAAAGLVAITAGVTHQLTKRATLIATPKQVVVTPAPTIALPPVAVKPDSSPPRAETVASSPESRVPSTESRVRLASNTTTKLSAEQTFAREITRLRAIVDARRTSLDPITLGVIERNLKLIDQAITECKQALQRDPASRFLMQSLNSSLESKLDLLRTAATLPTRS